MILRWFVLSIVYTFQMRFDQHACKRIYKMKTRKSILLLSDGAEFLMSVCWSRSIFRDDNQTEFISNCYFFSHSGNLERNKSNILLKTNLKTMPLPSCNTTILEFNREKDLPAFRDGISESQYCAYDSNGVNDSCEGDSGGPLQIIGDDTTTTKIVGIVSFSSFSCGTKFPSIYTRVASYLEWIEKHVWPNDDIPTPLKNYAF